MLTDDEHARLRVALYDLIARHVAEVVSTEDEHTWLAAMLAADAGVSCAAAEVSRALDARARRAGMTLAAIGAARGISKQSVSKRVSRG